MPKGPQGQKRPIDPNQLAKLIADIATGDVSDETSPTKPRGQPGGKVGGNARASSLSPARRSEIAKKAAAKRWGEKP
jgi:hypothetical protein